MKWKKWRRPKTSSIFGNMEEDNRRAREDEAMRDAADHPGNGDLGPMSRPNTDLWEFLGECPECHKQIAWRTTGAYYDKRFTLEAMMFAISCPRCSAAIPLLHFIIWGQTKLIDRLER